jgi:hypothetical protein
MPNTPTRPKDWFECVNQASFSIIYGQHSVEASQRIIDDTSSVYDDNFKESLRTWKCYIVWTEEDFDLYSLSLKYNQDNIHETFRSSLPKTIMHYRAVFIAKKRPNFVRSNFGADTPESRCFYVS